MMHHHHPSPRPTSILFLLLLLHTNLHPSLSSSTSSEPPTASQNPFQDVLFASPLKTLTFFDTTSTSGSSSSSSSPRSKFLKRFRQGIQSERQALKDIRSKETNRLKEEENGVFLEEDEEELGGSSSIGGYDDEEEEYFGGSEWAEYSKALEDEDTKRKRRTMEEAFEKGFHSVTDDEDMEDDETAKPKRGNKYQFIGVVMPDDKGNNVKWYARKKPSKATWSVRMVHVDKAALLRDLFVSGKVDIYGEYKNRGIPSPVVEDGEEVKKSGAIIEPRYSVKERSWRTLWNFSPKHFFTDRSGMFWRERRIRSGIYTDGQNVFESTYRYIEGKNGMRPLTGVDLNSFFKLWNADDRQKENVLKKVTSSSPDVVAEF